jgi:hypothetical protein
MKKIFLLAVVVGLSACKGPSGMALADQIEAVNACTKAGGTVSESRYIDNGAVARVNCYFDKGADRGKPCTDKGGVPIFSSWDGTLKNCILKAGSK